MQDIYITIVIPCFNEERNIRLGALEKVATFMRKKGYTWEVLLVDDGSSDESKRLIKDFIKENPSFKLIENQHQGKAATVISGMLRANSQFILFTDLDQATPMSELDILIDWMNKGYDVVIGSRNSRRRGAPLFRLAMAKGFMLLRNIILNLGIKDTQCGFKLFRRTSIASILGKLKLYKSIQHVTGSTVTAGFDVEVLYVAKKLGFKIKEIPVEWHYQETRHINPLKDSLEGLNDLVKIRLNSMRGAYS